MSKRNGVAKTTLYRIIPRTVTFGVEGAEYVGAEVIARADVSIGGYLQIRDLLGKEDAMVQVCELFGSGILQSWNLANEAGDPFPANVKGMKSIPMFLALRIVSSWISAIGEVPAPLEQESGFGKSLAELSAPMASE